MDHKDQASGSGAAETPEAAWRMVLDHADEPSIQKECVDAMERSLQLWLEYRDAVADASGIELNGRRSRRRMDLDTQQGGSDSPGLHS